MPRRRTSSKPVKKRTTTGCQTCRKRKIKCDEATPCGPCKKKGLQCLSYVSLKWESEYSFRGLAFGRAGLWSKKERSTPSPMSSSDLHMQPALTWCPVPRILASSFIAEAVKSHYQENDDTRDFDLEPSLYSLSVIPSGYRDLRTSSLLTYFTNKICPLTVTSKGATSPLSGLVLSFSLSASPLVFGSILALSACHRARTNAWYKPMALQYSSRALVELRSKLLNDPSGDAALHPETLVVVVMLCLYEIVSQCDRRWVVHLKGARDLIRLRQAKLPHSSSTTQSSEDIVLFAERFFAFQDVISRTACGEGAIFGSDFWMTTQECDPWMGCSQRLVALLHKITELNRRRRDNAAIVENVDFQRDAATLELELEHLDQTNISSGDSTLKAIADMKKTAAVLYLHCTLYDAAPTTPLVKQCVAEILDRLATLLLEGALSGLIWPLFVAAVEVLPDHELSMPMSKDGAVTRIHGQAFVLHALDVLSDTLTNIERTRNVILGIWKARENAPDSESHGDGSQWNDWEYYIAPHCMNMSLA
ncbi:hypothetical protein K491DRAFT_720571 [Lophiostoma macrostomum CBS 122681]|uniref:Zn(2)-C6 fungal-type domain-containing protein n=1 Tax=Lophiostoma macrostomum CBS 122681 TaxID=1314788 RepID=A0A6A6SW33_9PLEO|nr:hypothetical protein K491DRAFT_720571 [Lophiostoma macrostomum CBS 122681]